MAAVDQLNVATRNYINQSSKKLVDSVFTASLLTVFTKDRRIKSLRDSTGCSHTEASVAIDVLDAFIADDP